LKISRETRQSLHRFHQMLVDLRDGGLIFRGPRAISF
jgi:hypothetical protein